MVIGGLEAGGTKMVLAVANEDSVDRPYDRLAIPTRTPDETMPQMIAYFKEHNVGKIGIGCFGPLDLNPHSKTYGHITKTPKKEWADYDIVGEFQRALNVPVYLDTDVNGAALGEVMYGAAKGVNSAIYITIGTGIGVGVYVNGALLHGLVHPEGGHILLSRRDDDSATVFPGKCPFHKNCFEGLAAGPAIEMRFGKPAAELIDNPLVWDMEADYIAQALANYILAYSPEKIVLGGGVMHQQMLYPMIRAKVLDYLGGYVQSSTLLEDIENYIVSPGLGDNAGIVGALALANC